MSNWTSVEEELPKDGETVIAFNDDEKKMPFCKMIIGTYTSEDNTLMITTGHYGTLDNLTHWKYAPEPPTNT